MPISSFMGLNLALRGLTAEQRALDVTSHNIANADRIGYTRQEAVLAAAPALALPQGMIQSGSGAQLGQGVDVFEYRRIRDTFLDLQFRAQQMAYGEQQATSSQLGQVEDVLGEPGDNGLSAMLNRFWSAWQDLANNPESGAARATVIGAAQSVVDGFNRLDQQLADIGTRAAAEATSLSGATGPVQRIGDELGRLDTSISQAIQAGREPNDLLDRRDELLDELSKYGRVSVTELGSGSISVQFGDAALPLTNGSTVTWPQALTAPGGRIGALLDMSATTIPAYRASLDAAAVQLATTVNALHPTPVFAGASAAGLSVAATAASIQPSSSGAPGDNDIARAILALRGGAADTAYADLVRTIGHDAAMARAGAASAEAVVDAVQARRQEVAGVSMDEEMTNMIRFQRGYQASARAMTTLDEMLDVLINRTGRVGL